MWVWWSAVDAKCGGTRNMKGDSRLNCGGASWRRQILEVAFFANRRCCASRPKSCSPTQMHSRQSTNGSGNAIGPRLKALSKKYIRCVPFVTFHYKAHRPSPSLQITVKNPQANGRHMSLVCSKVTCISSPSSAAAKGKSLKSEYVVPARPTLAAMSGKRWPKALQSSLCTSLRESVFFTVIVTL